MPKNTLRKNQPLTTLCKSKKRPQLKRLNVSGSGLLNNLEITRKTMYVDSLYGIENLFHCLKMNGNGTCHGLHIFRKFLELASLAIQTFVSMTIYPLFSSQLYKFAREKKKVDGLEHLAFRYESYSGEQCVPPYPKNVLRKAVVGQGGSDRDWTYFASNKKETCITTPCSSFSAALKERVLQSECMHVNVRVFSD